MINEYIKNNGRAITDIDEFSSEYALDQSKVLYAIELIRSSKLKICGAEIVTEQDGKLIYAIHKWGLGYHYLSWYIQPNQNESDADYSNRSCDYAIECVEKALKTANELGEKCYFVLGFGNS